MSISIREVLRLGMKKEKAALSLTSQDLEKGVDQAGKLGEQCSRSFHAKLQIH